MLLPISKLGSKGVSSTLRAAAGLQRRAKFKMVLRYAILRRVELKVKKRFYWIAFDARRLATSSLSSLLENFMSARGSSARANRRLAKVLFLIRAYSLKNVKKNCLKML